MAPGPTSPSKSDVGLIEKAREWRGYLDNHRRRGEFDLRTYLSDGDEYDALLEAHCGRGLAGARVLEIGFGTRASRLAVLSAAGAMPTGVDLEVPLLDLKPATLIEIRRKNGIERLAKSVARYFLFDRGARARLRRGLAERYSRPDLDYGQIEVRDAADLDLPAGSLDLVISEDVFEHMRPASIEATLGHIRRWLAPTGLALLRPNVYTGITGGHLAEWNVESVHSRPLEPRRSAPWDHLRGQELAPNTFLNKLTRADYRNRFGAAGFEILEERDRYPELGAPLMTAAIRGELADYSDEDLFSNQTLFVLRSRG